MSQLGDLATAWMPYFPTRPSAPGPSHGKGSIAHKECHLPLVKAAFIMPASPSHDKGILGAIREQANIFGGEGVRYDQGLTF
jgi:hypothetical protein